MHIPKRRGESRDRDTRDAGRGNNGGRGRSIARGPIHRRSVSNRKSGHSVVVVGLRVGVESEIRVQLDDSVSIPLDLSVHRSAGGNRDGELADTSGDVESLRQDRTGGQGDRGGGSDHNDCIKGILHELVAFGLSNRVGGGGGVPRMRSGPHVDLVLGDLGEGSRLEGVGVVSRHVQPGGVVESVNPVLAVGLVTLDGTNVVGFAVVVPGDDLDDVNLVAVVDDGLPALGVQVVV